MMRLKQQSKVKTQVPVQPLEDAFNMNSKAQKVSKMVIFTEGCQKCGKMRKNDYQEWKIQII